ncbi:SMI1/KNR4 family protein [Oxalobacteraceae sp. CFBP 8763]|nr:SMI1/KNR4 family protein [Oxalobacteraceae sp. CFBP 8763]
MMESSYFSREELTQLRTHGIVLFANRVIFDAQPPMTSAAISSLQDLIGGKIPEALITLWQLTSGGRLDYDLSVSMHGREEPISWSELFYDRSDGYRDLTGWINYERELAEDEADDRQEVWDGHLIGLPFGGFEYCDRIYIVVAQQSEDYGKIFAWKMGLPPAWTGAMHQDGVGLIGMDLYMAFRALRLNADPLVATEEYFTGSELLGYLDDCKDNHGMPAPLADKLIAFYMDAIK